MLSWATPPSGAWPSRKYGVRTSLNILAELEVIRRQNRSLEMSMDGFARARITVVAAPDPNHAYTL